MKKISQHVARTLQKKVVEIERVIDQQRSGWSADWPGGVNIDVVNIDKPLYRSMHTARRLGHALVVIPRQNSGFYELQVYALPLPRVTP